MTHFACNRRTLLFVRLFFWPRGWLLAWYWYGQPRRKPMMLLQSTL